MQPEPGSHGHDPFPAHAARDRRFDPELARSMKGSVPDSGLLRAMLFRPTRFMLSHAVHVRFRQVFVIMWLSSSLAAIDQLELRHATGRTGMSTLNTTWAYVWGVAFGGGLIKGMVWYGVGGLWFRARLFMCGVRDASWEVTGRIFAFLHFPAMFASFLYYIGAWLAFDSFEDYLDSESLTWSLLAVIPVAAALYSSIMAYASVRGVFNANRFWAVLWFLLLPLTLRLTVLVGLMVVTWFMESSPKPDLDAPKSASITTITMQYPGNWVLTVDQPASGPARSIELQPTGHDASVFVEILYYDADADPIAETEAWLEDVGFELDPDRKPLQSWGMYSGAGYEYTSIKDGQSYVLRMFFSKLAHDGYLEVREIIHADSAERLEPGFELVRRTTMVRDPADLPADVRNAKYLEAGGVRFRAPSNWWLTRWVEEDAPPGVPPNFRLRAESGQLSVLSILGYRDSQGLRSELGRTLANLDITGRMEDERPLDRWLGLEGLGIEGIDRAKADGQRDRLIRLIVSERADGTIIEVLQVEFLDTKPLTAPGFELMESTFEVDPRPTRPEPTENP